jgi:hypothetical protein
MKTILLAAVAVTVLALPAFAGEGNGEPFANYDNGTTATVALRRADVGSNAYPNVAGRPGSVLNLYAAGVVPGTGSEQPAQTANSLPRGFERGLPVYASRRPTLSNIVVGNSIYLPRS